MLLHVNAMGTQQFFGTVVVLFDGATRVDAAAVAAVVDGLV